MKKEIVCENCSEKASKCNCWDDANMHEVIAYRLKHGLITSKFLEGKRND